MEAVVAGIEHDQITHGPPRGQQELSGNQLLEMLSTCNRNDQPELDDGSSRSSPSRRLKLTSMATKPLGEDDDRSCSSGSSPDSELWERLRQRRPARSLRTGEMGPWSPLPGKET